MSESHQLKNVDSILISLHLTNHYVESLVRQRRANPSAGMIGQPRYTHGV